MVVWFKLIGAYIVAVKLGDVTSSNLFMDEVFRRLSDPEKEHSYGVVRIIPTVYRRTQEGSPLRKIFAEYTAHKMDKDLFKRYVKKHEVRPGGGLPLRRRRGFDRASSGA